MIASLLPAAEERSIAPVLDGAQENSTTCSNQCGHHLPAGRLSPSVAIRWSSQRTANGISLFGRGENPASWCIVCRQRPIAETPVRSERVVTELWNLDRSTKGAMVIDKPRKGSPEKNLLRGRGESGLGSGLTSENVTDGDNAIDRLVGQTEILTQLVSQLITQSGVGDRATHQRPDPIGSLAAVNPGDVQEEITSDEQFGKDLAILAAKRIISTACRLQEKTIHRRDRMRERQDARDALLDSGKLVYRSMGTLTDSRRIVEAEIRAADIPPALSLRSKYSMKDLRNDTLAAAKEMIRILQAQETPSDEALRQAGRKVYRLAFQLAEEDEMSELASIGMRDTFSAEFELLFLRIEKREKRRRRLAGVPPAP